VITVYAEYNSMLPGYFTREAARKFAYKLTFKPINNMFEDGIWF
jgi:hypothetical protein